MEDVASLRLSVAPLVSRNGTLAQGLGQAAQVVISFPDMSIGSKSWTSDPAWILPDLCETFELCFAMENGRNDLLRPLIFTLNHRFEAHLRSQRQWCAALLGEVGGLTQRCREGPKQITCSTCRGYTGLLRLLYKCQSIFYSYLMLIS